MLSNVIRKRLSHFTAIFETAKYLHPQYLRKVKFSVITNWSNICFSVVQPSILPTNKHKFIFVGKYVKIPAQVVSMGIPR